MVRQAINHHRIKRNEKFHLGYKPSRTNLLIYDGVMLDVERNYKPCFYEYTEREHIRNHHDIPSFFVTYRDKSMSGSSTTVLQFEARYYGLNFFYRNDISDNDAETVVQSLSKVCRTFADDYIKNF